MRLRLIRRGSEIAFTTYCQLEAPLEPKCCDFFCYKQATPLESIKNVVFQPSRISSLQK